MLKRRCRRSWLLATSLLIAAPLACAQTNEKTLRDVLAGEHLPLDAESLRNLDKTITSGAELKDAARFVIAYYISDSAGLFNSPIFVDAYDRRRERWKSATIEATRDKVQGADADCLGSILEVSAVGDYLTLETHINPSAGCELVLSADLKLKASLYGWTVGQFGDGSIVYHRSQIHFATVHPTEIAIYNPGTGKDYNIFPREPFQQLRLQLMERLRAYYKAHEEYCRKANDPCDPQQFDSSLEGKVATDDREHAVAFVISYELQGFGQDENKPAGPAQVVYVYRHVNDEAKLEYREMLWSEMKQLAGDAELERLVEPPLLERIFGRESK